MWSLVCNFQENIGVAGPVERAPAHQVFAAQFLLDFFGSIAVNFVAIHSDYIFRRTVLRD